MASRRRSSTGPPPSVFQDSDECNWKMNWLQRLWLQFSLETGVYVCSTPEAIMVTLCILGAGSFATYYAGVGLLKGAQLAWAAGTDTDVGQRILLDVQRRLQMWRLGL